MLWRHGGVFVAGLSDKHRVDLMPKKKILLSQCPMIFILHGHHCTELLEVGGDLLNNMLELEVGVSGRELQLQHLCQELKKAYKNTQKSVSYYAYPIQALLY